LPNQQGSAECAVNRASCADSIETIRRGIRCGETATKEPSLEVRRGGTVDDDERVRICDWLYQFIE
jgi:hypothetical protein